MGSAMIVPECDERMQKLCDLFLLSDNDLARFYKCFDKLDTERVGLIPIETLFEYVEYKRNLYTDALLELLDIDYSDGEINFSEFLDIVVTYCMFEKMELLKFCMSIFREENSASISALPDLKQLMDIVHNVEQGEHVIGNSRTSWNKMTFQEDYKVSLEELYHFHDMFPKLFQPAFFLQFQMMAFFLGESWWIWKKNVLRCRLEDEEARKVAEEILKKKLSPETRARNRKIKRNMGVFMYYLAPCFRHYYDPTKEPEEPDDEEEKARQKALNRKAASLAAKNPETPASRTFAEKTDPRLGKGGSDMYVTQKHAKTARQREYRQQSRYERKLMRKGDPDIVHQFSSSLNSKI